MADPDDIATRYAFDRPGNPWMRWIPAWRIVGPVVFVLAIAAGYPREDPDGWRGPLAIALVAGFALAFWVMWIRRPIWEHEPRTFAAHGALLIAGYAALLAISPGFAFLQVVIYPQVLFTIPTPWSIVAGASVGAVSAIHNLAVAGGDVVAAWPDMLFSIVLALMFITMAMINSETISLSVERRALIDELTATRQEAAAAERKAGVAEERARLAREIHDTLAQGFASVVTHLEAADASMSGINGDSPADGAERAEPADGAERARRDMRAAREIARASLAEARTLVWTLRPETIATAGLPAAIERVAAAAGSSTGPAIEVTVSGRARQLHPEVEVTLLRAAQEALSNALRHAEASRITLTLTYFTDEVSLDVTDDGQGFDPSTAHDSGGLGLLGMRERAERLGGALTIESTPGEGTALAVTVPAVEAPASLDETVAGSSADGDAGRLNR